MDIHFLLLIIIGWLALTIGERSAAANPVVSLLTTANEDDESQSAVAEF